MHGIAFDSSAKPFAWIGAAAWEWAWLWDWGGCCLVWVWLLDGALVWVTVGVGMADGLEWVARRDQKTPGR